MSQKESTQITNIIRHSYHLELSENSPLKTYVPLKLALLKPAAKPNNIKQPSEATEAINNKSSIQNNADLPDASAYITKVVDANAIMMKKKQEKEYKKQLDEQISKRVNETKEKSKQKKIIDNDEVSYAPTTRRIALNATNSNFQNTHTIIPHYPPIIPKLSFPATAASNISKASAFESTNYSQMGIKPLADINSRHINKSVPRVSESFESYHRAVRSSHPTNINSIIEYHNDEGVSVYNSVDISHLKSKISVANDQFNSKLIEMQVAV